MLILRAKGGFLASPASSFNLLSWRLNCWVKMARFTSQSDSEPLMRLERPSTARSQTTAHVINACFNEILSHKPLDSKEINNLAVSKRENSESDYQEYYVDKLKKVKRMKT